MEEVKQFDGWIRLDDFCRKCGLRANTLQKKVHDDVWQRGVHYSSPDGGEAYVHEARCLETLKPKKEE